MLSLRMAILAGAVALPGSLAVTDEFENAHWTLSSLEFPDGSKDGPVGLFSGVVMYDGLPLCDDDFNDHAATVLCRHFQLGNHGTFQGHTVDTDDFGADNMNCPENAKMLQECTWDTDFEDCVASEGVEIFCSMWTLQYPAAELLANWELPDLPHNVGLVHFNMKPVCDDNLNADAANALCRTMDLGWFGEFQGNQYVGTEDFGADELSCPDDAHSIHECTFSHTEHDCNSQEGVLLKCSDGWSLTTPDFDDVFHNEGFVMYHGSPMCEVGDMTSYAADLICQELGWDLNVYGVHGEFSVRKKPSDLGDFGSANPVCPDSDDVWHVSDCMHNREAVSCPESDRQALYVKCSFEGWNLFQAEKGLVGTGKDRYLSGFVHFENTPLCSYGVGWKEANKLCQTMQRGYRGEWVEGVGHSADGADGEFIGHLNCENDDGSEVDHINECFWEKLDGCKSNEVAFLQCHTGYTLEKSKWGGDNFDAGFLFYDGEPICKEGFSTDAATAVCRTWWGIGYVGSWQQKALTTEWIAGARATNTLSCPHGALDTGACELSPVTEEQQLDCTFADVVYLSCHKAWTLERGDESGLEGFVYYDGKPLCDDSFNKNNGIAASLLCKAMDLGEVVTFETQRDVSTDDFGADNLTCLEGAEWLDDCTFTTHHDCSSGEGVWLQCQGQ